MPQVNAKKRTATAQFALNGSLSQAINLGNAVLTGVVMPAAWTTAAFTFQVSMDGVTFSNLYDSAGTEVTIANTVNLASRGLSFAPALRDLFAPWSYVKIRSGTAQTPVAQEAARDVICVIRDVA